MADNSGGIPIVASGQPLIRQTKPTLSLIEITIGKKREKRGGFGEMIRSGGGGLNRP
jgi:hypothetical protein